MKPSKRVEFAKRLLADVPNLTAKQLMLDWHKHKLPGNLKAASNLAYEELLQIRKTLDMAVDACGRKSFCGNVQEAKEKEYAQEGT